MNETFYVSTQVVGWFSLSLIISGIAQGMNRGGFFWGVMGVLFGPLALLVLVLMGKER
ncbi:hypothetical protein ACFL2D_03200 [Patescibacteria group bacterium]